MRSGRTVSTGQTNRTKAAIAAAAATADNSQRAAGSCSRSQKSTNPRTEGRQHDDDGKPRSHTATAAAGRLVGLVERGLEAIEPSCLYRRFCHRGLIFDSEDSCNGGRRGLARWSSPTAGRAVFASAIRRQAAHKQAGEQGRFQMGLGGSDSMRTCRPRGRSLSSLPAVARV